MKIKLFYSLIAFIVLFNLIFICESNAANTLGPKPASIPVEDVFSGTEFTSSANIDTAVNDTQTMALSILANVLVVFRIVGTGIAIIVLMAVGGKLIFGSIEQKVEAKKHLVAYACGIVALFGGSFLLGIIHNFIMKNW